MRVREAVTPNVSKAAPATADIGVPLRALAAALGRQAARQMFSAGIAPHAPTADAVASGAAKRCARRGKDVSEDDREG